MRVVVLYRERSEQARPTETFLGDFYRRTGREIEAMDPDTREGSSLARTYDVVEYPTLIALDDNGRLQNMWRGLPLPTISEVSYYVQ